MKLGLSKEDRKDYNRMFWRQMTGMSEMTYVRLEGPGFGWALMPFLRKVYKDDDEAYFDAVQRNMMYFNTNYAFLPLIQGIVMSMEKQNAKHPSDSINEQVNGLKVGLMGPLAGLGDSFFVGTLRVIAAGVGMSLAMKGSILGALLFLLIYHIPFYLIRYYGGIAGYSLGANYIGKAQESGLLNSITKGASMLGIIMIGAMTYLNVPFKLSVAGKLAGSKFVLQDTLDKILPGLLPLGFVWFCIWLIRKKHISTTKLLILILLVSVILGGLGLAGK